MPISEILTIGAMKIGTIAVSELVKSKIPGNGVGFDILKETSGAGIEFGSEKVSDKIKNHFFGTPTLKEKLGKILIDEFNRLNEYKYGDKFTGYIEYAGNDEATLQTKEQLIENIKEWNKTKASNATITQTEINDFVKDYFHKINEKIDADDALKQYVEIIKTSANTEVIVKKLDEVVLKLEDSVTREDLYSILSEIVSNHPEHENLVSNLIEIGEHIKHLKMEKVKQESNGTGLNRIIIKGESEDIEISDVTQTIT